MSSFPLPGWSRDWSRPMRRGSRSYFVVVPRGHLTPCWIWQGRKTPTGYGRANRPLASGGGGAAAHRLLYEQTIGPVPEGLEIDHLCRTRSCCNPDHLEPVTHQENVRRSTIGHNLERASALMTHCPRGHAYVGANAVHNGAGRACRSCKRFREKRNRLIRLGRQAEADLCVPEPPTPGYDPAIHLSHAELLSLPAYSNEGTTTCP